MTWSRMFLVALLVLGVTVGVAGVLRLADPPASRPQPAERRDVAEAPLDPTLAVLHEWDRRRALAWAEGDLRALRRLYTPGSTAGLRDRTMLRRWTARGLVVRDLAVQVLDAHVREHTVDRIVVEVTDRLAGAVAVGSGVRRDLPVDRASTRTVTFRRVAEDLTGEWRVASVR
ncbi:MAG: hypothetical protein JWO11_1732 [Nocardioides sp.]|nr:hypothetical protein [Nocardioides sp.]